MVFSSLIFLYAFLPLSLLVYVLCRGREPGETISLVDLANAVKADKERGKAAKPEKKPSIRAQLAAAKEKTTPKKAAKTRRKEMEV